MADSKRQRINVLHVVSKLPMGGVENMLMKVVKGYDKERFNARICCIKSGGEIADKLDSLGYRVDILHRMQGRGFDPGAVFGLYTFMKNNNVHVLRTHQYHANLYGRLAGILAGVPVIVPSFHSRYYSPGRPKLHRRIINNVLARYSDALVAVSETVASDIARYDRVAPEKIKVNYNGVDIDTFMPDATMNEAREKLDIPVNDTVIGTLGRLKKEKGHAFLLKAVSGMSGLSVAFAGDGPLRDELVHQGDEARVTCIFKGNVDPGAVPLFLRSLDIFCFPSLWEGFPTALIEAMASGLPVIASDIPSHREIVGDAGILVPAGDAAALSVAVKRLIGDPRLRASLGNSARERAGRFSIEKTIGTYETLFEELIGKKAIQ